MDRSQSKHLHGEHGESALTAWNAFLVAGVLFKTSGLRPCCNICCRNSVASSGASSSRPGQHFGLKKFGVGLLVSWGQTGQEADVPKILGSKEFLLVFMFFTCLKCVWCLSSVLFQCFLSKENGTSRRI